MHANHLSAPFGDILLELEATSNFRTADDAAAVRPVLPDGMRIDDCRLHTASIDCKSGDIFTIRLAIRPAESWIVDFASGEWFDAFELSNRDRGTAAVGMRDIDWLCQKFGIVYLDASNAAAGAHALTATYRALSRTTVDVQTAYAWTIHPKTELEASSPWHAVDLAMFS
jgi:hypothetical protein